MLLSRKWLDEFVHVDANDKEFAEAMTLSGSKVETTEDRGAEIDALKGGLQVGQHFGVQGVERLGTVDRHNGDGVLDFAVAP